MPFIDDAIFGECVYGLQIPESLSLLRRALEDVRLDEEAHVVHDAAVLAPDHFKLLAQVELRLALKQVCMKTSFCQLQFEFVFTYYTGCDSFSLSELL